ncbi:acyltransferase [Actinomadura sp. NAK00032]|uniref:acyltransferase family protein n=1 Tax=Actinomadura sp. NAK00032 TaxID=2742128 RepID=UPI001591A6DD|nr:acyltransferase [Actinomadura sp. NAK00032]QKW34597.1 acyltransferase [Actinomadura sp. NAK00032]
MTGRERLRELDLLRFAAALAVVLYHFTGFGGAGPWPEPSAAVFPGLGDVTRFGYLGVDLFFVISGFVILMSAWGRGPGEFGVSRLVRLMPAYWVSVLLGAVVYAVFRQGHGVPGLVLPNLTMLQGGLGLRNVDAVYWTLWVELHFYVLIAVLASIGITYRSCLVFMAAWLFAGVYADEADNDLLQVMLIPTWSCYFIAGMALYMIHRFGPTLLLWGYVAVTYLIALHWGAWRAEHVFRGANEIVVSAVITGIFAVMILVATRRLRWLRWSRLTVLGALTYPLYLVHSQLALPLLDALYPDLGKWPALCVVVAASLLSAYAVHRLVERPGAAWMKARLYASLEPLRRSVETSKFVGHGGRGGPARNGIEPPGRTPVDAMPPARAEEVDLARS